MMPQHRIDADAEYNTQSEELRQLAALSREAAEILWEMAAMQDAGDAAQEMLEKSTTLQVRLVSNSIELKASMTLVLPTPPPASAHTLC